MERILGKVAITPKGEWVLGAYDILDLVTYEGSSYLSRKPTSQPLSDESAWQLVAERGQSFRYEDLTPSQIEELQEPASNARGWSPLLVSDTTTISGKILLKLQSWIGGTGTAPTINVGQWQKADGTYTTVASDANDIRGDNANPIKGIATETNAPTPWVSGDPDLFEKWEATTPITVASAWGIEVTQAELDENNVFFYVTNGSISIYSKPILRGADGTDGKTTEQWSEKPFVAGSTVYHEGDIWENVSPATATDEPNEDSLIWVQRIKTIKNITTVEGGFAIVDEDNNIVFKINEEGETSFIPEEVNARDNMQSIFGFSGYGDLGNDGEIYFCDRFGNIGVKISKDGKFDAADFGNISKQLLANIVRNIVDSNGNTLADNNSIHEDGQSLSVGQTEKIITATQSNPRLLCFDGVVRTSAYDKSLTGDTYPINRRIAFAPLVERVNDGQSAGLLRETPASGIGEMFVKSYSESLFKPLDKNVILSAPGWGATTIAQLSKGGTYYAQLIADVTAAKNLSDAAGKTYRCLAVTWTQGESDYLSGTTLSAYKTALKQRITDINIDVKAITGQTEDVILVCYQLVTAMHAARAYPNIAIALHEASKEDARIYLATPMYHMIYNDGFHLTAASSKLLGAYYGDVINRITVLAQDWKPVHINNKAVNGNVITLNYHIPDGGSLLFDAPNGITLPNKGFTFADGSSIITNVSIGTDGQSVVITCSASPSGKLLQYGVAWHQISNTKANLGNIRDNAGVNRRMVIDNVDTPLHNWAVIEEVQL